MSFIESFKIAVSCILSNKVRSLLTMLGLIIGISSVVTIMAIGAGSQSSIQSQLDDLGTNVITLMTNRGVSLTNDEQLNMSDVQSLSERFSDDLIGVVPQMSQNASVLADLDDNSITLTASIPNMTQVDNLTLLAGRDFTALDLDRLSNNIIIDSDTAESLYNQPANAIGQDLFISSQNTTTAYRIIGVYESESTNSGFSSSSGYVPYTTIQKNYNVRTYLSSIMLALKDDASADTFGDQVVNYMAAKKGNQGDDKYTTFNMEDQIEMVSSVLGSITLLISAIAAISLIVGGIGVMNIMLVSVTERTREIGIRKALGARKSSIQGQFLIESVVVSLLGGIIGTIVGYILSYILGQVIDVTASVQWSSVLFATLFSSLIGIIFGVYPATKAAKLDPIEALRYE